LKKTKNKIERTVSVALTKDFKKRSLKLPAGTTLEQLVKMEKASKQTIVLLVNGKVAHPSTVLKQGDDVELVGVIYGG